jgi:uncharacterized protein YjbI with pentapeptide repeats/predicted nucleic acid-binding Zn ribbon protein
VSEEQIAYNAEQSRPEPQDGIIEGVKDEKKCPVCKKLIDPEAIKCTHCNEFIKKYERERPPSSAWVKVLWKNRSIWDLVKLIIIIGLAIWFLRLGITTGLIPVLVLTVLLILEKYVRLCSPEITAVGEGTTIWDLAKVLIVPIVLAAVGFFFAYFQEQRQLEREDRLLTRQVEATETRRRENIIAATTQKVTDVAATDTRQAVETTRAKENAAAQSTLEANRLNEDILEAYFDDMSTLILETENITKTRIIERARTLSTLSRLDGKRKGALIRFLSEAKRITSDTTTREVVIRLTGANLFGADLFEANLFGADLSEANLSGANLSEANLSGANLKETNLSQANLSQANLSGADLKEANLFDADLSQADLSGVNLKEAKIDETTQFSDKWRLVWEIVDQGAAGRDLSEADLSEANLFGADLSEANLSEANLYKADLFEANLSEADLSKANLSETDLSEADLSRANLSGANLRRTGLLGADLSGANLSEADLIEADLIEADLSQASLRRTGLLGADLSRANLSEADLSEARYNIEVIGAFGQYTRATRWPKDFDPEAAGATLIEVESE